MRTMAARSPSSSSPSPDPATDGERPGTILVADADGVSRRFVELSLGYPGFHVESVADGASALEVLGTTPVDLILSEMELTDMNGLQLYRRLTQESRLRGIPFLVLTSDRRVETKALAFSSGVDDYLVKPCDGLELVARVRSHVARQRRANHLFRQRNYTLAGALSTIPFPDLVSIIEVGRRSGRLSLVTAERVGAAFFRDGQVVHALFGSLSGPGAFYWMMAEEDGQFEFSPGPCPIDESHRTIFDPVANLILEGARVIDTARASGTMPALDAGEFGVDQAAVATTPDLRILSRLAAVAPSPAVAGQLASGVKEPYALGDLRLFTKDQLIAWTRAELGRDRFHVHLVADLAAGVSSILSLAGAPTERWVLDSLTAEPKAAGLALFLRNERLVDLILVDIDDPRPWKVALERDPSLLIIAPRDGDFLTVGAATRVELEGFLSQLRPAAILGIGNRSLEPGLRGLVSLKETPADLRVVPGALGQPDCDLRAILVEGLKAWTTSAPGAAPPEGAQK
jgi:CheY-like chemotaxis protein